MKIVSDGGRPGGIGHINCIRMRARSESRATEVIAGDHARTNTHRVGWRVEKRVVFDSYGLWEAIHTFVSVGSWEP